MSVSKKESNYHALIMAGGKGERFWPWSREKRPKQLLPIFGKKTMIEMTVRRLLPLIPKQRIWILTNADQARVMQRLMPFLPKSNFVIEPIGRGTASAIMLGCATVAKKDPEAVMALLPADHLIKNTKSYLRDLKKGFQAASSQQALLTIGIKPAEPTSELGYIERGNPLKNHSGIYQVNRFIEKPKMDVARRLVKSPKNYWNAGMFVWSAEAIYKAFKCYSPVYARGWDALLKNRKRFLARDFKNLPKTSIDYAVMEKAKNIFVINGTFDWDDVGYWTALYSHVAKEGKGWNPGQWISMDSPGCLVIGNKKTVATLGVKDLIIVQTDDAMLVCHRDQAQHVREIVKQLPSNLR